MSIYDYEKKRKEAIRKAETKAAEEKKKAREAQARRERDLLRRHGY